MNDHDEKTMLGEISEKMSVLTAAVEGHTGLPMYLALRTLVAAVEGCQDAGDFRHLGDQFLEKFVIIQHEQGDGPSYSFVVPMGYA